MWQLQDAGSVAGLGYRQKGCLPTTHIVMLVRMSGAFRLSWHSVAGELCRSR